MENSELEKLSGYMSTLCSEQGNDIPDDVRIAFKDCEQKDIQTPLDCLDCLGTLSMFNLPLTFLITTWKYWGIYVKSLASTEFHEALDKALSNNEPTDLMRFLRACYRFGVSVIPDQEYDNMEVLYKTVFPEADFLYKEAEESFENLSEHLKEAVRLAGFEPTVDVDEPAIEMLGDKVEQAAIGGESSEIKCMDLSGNAYDTLNSEKSTSIKPLRSYEEAWEYFKNAPRVRVHFSLKIDGINTKGQRKEDGSGVEVAVSRGRASDSFDYTEAIRRVFEVNNVDCSIIPLRFTGESVVDVELLEKFRQSDSVREYKTPKSAASAMLRAPQKFNVEDYKYLHFYAFDCGELPKDEAFKILKKAGLRVPPAIIVELDEHCLNDFNAFKVWLDTILDDLWESAMTSGIGKESTDGVVAQLLTDYEVSSDDKYSSLNVALKFSHWTEQCYESAVEAILFEQKRVEMSVVLVVKPVTTRDLNIATRVSIGSPAILVNDDVRVGDVIRFSRKSEAINIYEGKK